MAAFGDVTNDPLLPKLIMFVRVEALKYFDVMGVNDGATLDVCHPVTGKAPIGTRWIDINKGDSTKTNYRSRLVVKESMVGVRPELFAAILPQKAYICYFPKRPKITDKGYYMWTSAERTFALRRLGQGTSSCRLKTQGLARRESSASP